MVKNPPDNAGDLKRHAFDPWVGRYPGGGRATHSIFLPGESHGQRSLAAMVLRVTKTWAQLK